MEKIKVIIADQSTIFTEGLKSILKDNDKIVISGVVQEFNELESLIKENQPHILILDYASENFGEDKVAVISAKFPEIKLMAITEDVPKTKILRTLKAGLNSYLLKDCSKDEVLEAVQETYNEKQFFCGKVVDLITHTEEDTLCEEVAALSEREREVIKLVAEGFTTKEIAEKLFISDHTVNTHRKNIMHKLGLKNTAGIVIYAVKENIVAT